MKKDYIFDGTLKHGGTRQFLKRTKKRRDKNKVAKKSRRKNRKK